MRLRFLTAGESHGPALTVIVEGLPAGVPLDREGIDRDLVRRMGGYGRGGRMKIERDRVEILGGVRFGRSLGSPVSFVIRNLDFANWAEAMNPDHYVKGFHTTGTVGVFAAVAGAAKLYGLGPEQVRFALGIAASKSAGLRVNFGTMTKPYHAGAAAENGVTAARLARLGYQADPNALDGPWGYFQVTGGGCDPDRLLGRLQRALNHARDQPLLNIPASAQDRATARLAQGLAESGGLALPLHDLSAQLSVFFSQGWEDCETAQNLNESRGQRKGKPERGRCAVGGRPVMATDFFAPGGVPPPLEKAYGVAA